jgi:hypothetical protein
MKYRKKPVIVEAMQWDGTEMSGGVIEEWAKGDGETYIVELLKPYLSEVIAGTGKLRLVTPTLEGYLDASPNDFIIRGVAGEFYPRKPDIFAATYEAVE